MKLFTVILFVSSLNVALSQQVDSLFVKQAPDSLSIGALVQVRGDSVLTTFTIPNCSELIKIDGLWNWLGSSSQYNYPLMTGFGYCGTCVVKFDKDTTNAVGYEYYVPRSNPYNPPSCPSLLENQSPGKINIISNYSNGKRHGLRKYYNRNGQLIKTETYNNGKLISTVIHHE